MITHDQINVPLRSIAIAKEHPRFVLERKNQEKKFFLSKSMPNLQFCRTLGINIYTKEKS